MTARKKRYKFNKIDILPTNTINTPSNTIKRHLKKTIRPFEILGSTVQGHTQNNFHSQTYFVSFVTFFVRFGTNFVRKNCLLVNWRKDEEEEQQQQRTFFKKLRTCARGQKNTERYLLQHLEPFLFDTWNSFSWFGSLFGCAAKIFLSL